MQMLVEASEECTWMRLAAERQREVVVDCSMPTHLLAPSKPDLACQKLSNLPLSQ